MTYDTNKSNQRARKAAALQSIPSAKSGDSLDEYPFASTMQDRKGSSVMEVLATQQAIQGGIIGGAVTANKMETGDRFQVIPAPDKDKNPGNEPVPNPTLQPQKPGFWDFVKVVGVIMTQVLDLRNIKVPAPAPTPCYCQD